MWCMNNVVISCKQYTDQYVFTSGPLQMVLCRLESQQNDELFIIIETAVLRKYGIGREVSVL